MVHDKTIGKGDNEKIKKILVKILHFTNISPFGTVDTPWQKAAHQLSFHVPVSVLPESVNTPIKRESMICDPCVVTVKVEPFIQP